MIQKEAVHQTVLEYYQNQSEQENPHAKSLALKVKFLPTRQYSVTEQIIPSSLVRLKFGEIEQYCYIIPEGGGLVFKLGNYPVQVVSTRSQLGEALIGRKKGDIVSINYQSQKREYQILDCC